MTKLLVLSDSHGGRTAIERVLMKESKNIDALIFLGDGLRDLELALTLYPKLRAYSVAGNCDYGALEPTDGLAAFDGVVIFYTHGHMYGVKYDLDTLADAASARGAEVALFGHTHGGQISFFGKSPFFNLKTDVGPRYMSGWLEENRAAVLISNGVGTSGAPVRLFAPPQIHLITLKSR